MLGLLIMQQVKFVLVLLQWVVHPMAQKDFLLQSIRIQYRSQSRLVLIRRSLTRMSSPINYNTNPGVVSPFDPNNFDGWNYGPTDINIIDYPTDTFQYPEFDSCF